MPNVYTWGAQPATRNLTVADLRAAKGKQQFTQVTANTSAEAAAAGAAGIDMMLCSAHNVEVVREANDHMFLTAALAIPDYPTEKDILEGALRALALGADAVFTARSMQVVEMLAREEIPVMGHLGLVPRKSTWVGGLRAVGKTGDEAFDLYQRFKRLEDAGAVLVEAEVIPGDVMREIASRSELICVSLGSGHEADVNYLFMNDICGEQKTAPRHARAFGNLHRLYKEIEVERVRALTAFREAAMDGTFPGKAETVQIDSAEFEKFLNRLER